MSKHELPEGQECPVGMVRVARLASKRYGLILRQPFPGQYAPGRWDFITKFYWSEENGRHREGDHVVSVILSLGDRYAQFRKNK